MAPAEYTYIDHYQGDPATEPLAIGDFLPLDTVYDYEPIPRQLTPTEAAHVLGAQGNLWAEYISTPSYAQYMLFPRMLALAEVVWSPKEARNRARLYARLPAHFARLDALGARYRVPEPSGPWGDRRVIEDRIRVTMASPIPGGVVRYTVDGSEPTASSPRYRAPVEVRVTSTPVTVRARLFLPNGRASPPATARIVLATWHEAVAVRGDTLRPGLTYAYYEGGTFQAADDVRQRGTPSRVATATTVALLGDERPEQFGLRFTGFLRVPSDAMYTFHVSSDDGAKLRIDDELVVDHDGQHATTEKRGEAALRAGYHRVEVTFFQGPGGKALQLEVSAPGVPRRTVPAEWLAH
jgi:hexosaminidase